MWAARDRASRGRARWGRPLGQWRGGGDARWEGKSGTLCPAAVAHHGGGGRGPPTPALAPRRPSASPATGRRGLGEALNSLVLVLLCPPSRLQPSLSRPLLAFQQHLLGEGRGRTAPSHRERQYRGRLTPSLLQESSLGRDTSGVRRVPSTQTRGLGGAGATVGIRKADS